MISQRYFNIVDIGKEWDLRCLGLHINYMGDGLCGATGIPTSLILTLFLLHLLKDGLCGATTVSILCMLLAIGITIIDSF